MRANKAFRWLWRGAHGSQQVGAASQQGAGAGSQQGAGAGSQQGAASQPQSECLWKNLCNNPPRHLGAHGSQASQTGAGSQQTGSQHESQPRPQPPNKPACALAPLIEIAKAATKAERMKRIGNSPKKCFLVGRVDPSKPNPKWLYPQSSCVLASIPELVVMGRLL